jgi:thiamine biosynthesis lipoprotein
MNDANKATQHSAENRSEAFRLAHRFAHSAMGTVFEIACIHADAGYAREAAQAAFDLIDRLETDLSRHRSSSDIARVNHLKPGEIAQVGSWTLECLLMASYFHQQTQGAFDISLGSGLDSVELMPQQTAVRIHKSGIRLNLGGIGKGYAIDRAAELLEEWGISQALLHGGYSSVLALDPPPDCDGWPLTISLPGAASNRTLRSFSARRQSWSSSGIRKKDHILDPRSGVPVRQRLAAWAAGGLEAMGSVFPRKTATGLPDDFFETGASPSAVTEALSTAFMILPTEAIASYCLAHPGVEAYVLNSDPSNPASSPLLISFTH